VLHTYSVSGYCKVSNMFWPPLLSTGQSSWLQIQRSGFDFRRYQIFWQVVALEGAHSASWVQLRSYLKEKVVAPVFKTEDPPRWLRDTPLSSKVGSGRLLSIVRSRTKATEFWHTWLPVYCIENNGLVSCGVLVWGTVLQVGRLRILFPLRSLHSSVDLILPATLWPWNRVSL
jgi:hypothetical protein